MRPSWSALALPFALLTGCAMFEPPAPPPPPPRPVDMATARCMPLAYPPGAARMEASGTTIVGFTLDASGIPSALSVVQPSGTTPEHKRLDNAALRSTASCRFAEAPGFSPVRVSRPVAWRLD